MSNTERPTLCLGIPTINRKDLLEEALEVYKKTWRKRHIFIVDNGNQDIADNPPYLKAWGKGVNLGVAASWNKMIERQRLLGYSHILILNDDVILHKSPFDIEDFIEQNPADFYTGGGYYSFILPFSTYDAIGGFDEKFYPAYYEDNDYTYRLQTAGKSKLDSEYLKPETFRSSKSGEKDKTLYDFVFRCRTYYEQKWGGAPSEEKFVTPFNL